MDKFVKSISNVARRGRNWCAHSESEGKRKEKSYYGKTKGEIVQTVKYIFDHCPFKYLKICSDFVFDGQKMGVKDPF